MKKVTLGLLFAFSLMVIFTSCEEKSESEKLKDKIEDAGEKVSESIEDVSEKVGDAVEDAGEKVEEIVEEGEKDGKKGLNKLKDKLKND